MMEDPFRKVRPSRLILKDNSRLVCKGHIQTFEAVKIECLPNAVVEIGDKSYETDSYSSRIEGHDSS